jgi:acetoin utilization deacetylase AcuC-like enzyme
MLPFSLVYSDGFYLDMGPHVFPGEKYSLVHARLLETRAASPPDFIAPEPIAREDLLRVHDAGYIDRLLHGTLDPVEIRRMELAYSKRLVDATLLGCGGTLLAARLALRDGVACCLGGGFHHAYPAHGEGFCILHDVAIALRRLMGDRAIRSALVIDLDVHQGNGTAAIFPPQGAVILSEQLSAGILMGSNRPSAERVFTLSLHQFNNYPGFKPPSSIDVHLNDGTEDAEYMSALDRALAIAIKRHRPDLVVYIAGADPYVHDQLGGLALTIKGLRERDARVFRFAQTNQLPIVSVYAGGYARDVNDTVTIHTNTVLAAADIFHFHGATSC